MPETFSEKQTGILTELNRRYHGGAELNDNQVKILKELNRRYNTTQEQPSLSEAVVGSLKPKQSLAEGADVISLPTLGETALNILGLPAHLLAAYVSDPEARPESFEQALKRGRTFQETKPGRAIREKVTKESLFVKAGILSPETQRKITGFVLDVLGDPLVFTPPLLSGLRKAGKLKKFVNLVESEKTVEAAKVVDEIKALPPATRYKVTPEGTAVPIIKEKPAQKLARLEKQIEDAGKAQQPKPTLPIEEPKALPPGRTTAEFEVFPTGEALSAEQVARLKVRAKAALPAGKEKAADITRRGFEAGAEKAAEAPLRSAEDIVSLRRGELPQRAAREIGGDLLTPKQKAIAKGRVTKLTGRDFSKGLLKATIEDIKGETLGIVADPLKHTRDFISKNALKLTDDEIEALTNFTRKVARTEGATADEQVKLINEWVGKNLKVSTKAPIEDISKATGKEIKDFVRNNNKTTIEQTEENLRKQFREAKTPEEQVTIAQRIDVLTQEMGKKPKLPQQEVIDKVTQALKDVKPLRGKQERIYTKERGQKIGKFLEKGKKVSGEEGFKKQRAQLAGEMTKVQFESLRDKISQKEVDTLFDMVKTSSLNEWDKITAGNGLGKLLGETGGKVPTKGEISKLEEVFGKGFVDEIVSKRSLFQKFKDAGLELANIPRSLMASFDLSAPFRQGIFTAARHPKIFFSNFIKQFRLFGSEKYYQQVLKEIHSRPTYKAMQENKLALTELADLTKREEIYMSNWAEKIPVVGKGVRASGRAYTGFLDRMRADLFDQMYQYGEKFGLLDDPKYLQDAAKFINAATGRGGLGKLERAAVPLNSFFFSPRLLASRLQLLNPSFYVKLEPAVRKEALKSLLSFGGMALTVSGVGKLAGADIETDPRNANFLKLKFGNTRYDPLGGFQQPIRAAAQIISGKIISSTTGKEITLGEGYKPLTRLDIGTRFFEMKEAPLVSFATALMRGRTSIGEKVDVPTEVANRFIPMVAQDMHDIYRERGAEGVAMATPAIFGVGVQTYGGLQVWGVDNKDYPTLNKELNRLKTSAGFPSSTANGKELSNTEYKKLRRVTGLAIAQNLNQLIRDREYRGLSDEERVKRIEREIDSTKRVVKKQLFPDKESTTRGTRPYRRIPVRTQ